MLVEPLKRFKKNFILRNYAFKILLFLFCYSTISKIYSQTIQLIPNPDNGKGFSRGFCIYDNKLFFQYQFRSEEFKLVSYDEKQITTVSNLLNLSSFNPNFTKVPAIYNNKLYLSYQSNLAEYNGDTVKLISGPNKFEFNGWVTKYKNKMYFPIISSGLSSFTSQLANFDGNKINLISNLPGYKNVGLPFVIIQNKLNILINKGNFPNELGLFDSKEWSKIDFTGIPMSLGVRSVPVELNNKTYFRFGSDVDAKLAVFDGIKVKLLVHPVIGVGIYDSEEMLNYKGDLIFNYRTIYYDPNKSYQSIYQLGTVKNDSVILISNPESGNGPQGGTFMSRGPFNPIIFRNEYYFAYSNKSSITQLAKYDGNKITLIDNPINTKEYSNESSGPIIYQNGLYIIFKSNNNINKLYRFDGVKYSLVDNPDSGQIPNFEEKIIFKNSLYINYLNSNGEKVIAKITENNTIPPPVINISKNNFCDGDSVLLTSSQSVGNVWYLNDVEIKNETNSFIYAKEGGYYSVSYRDANFDISPKSAPVKLVAYYSNLIPIITTKDSLNICSDSKITLKSNLKSGIQWYKDNLKIASTNDSSLVTNLSGTYYAKILSNGCYSDSSNNLIIKIKSNPEKPKFNTSNFSFCQGDTLKLSIINLNKKDTLKWFFGNKIDSSNTSSKFFLDTAKVFVLKKDSLNCFISSDTISLVKKQLPSSPIISRDTSNNLVSNYLNSNIWFKDGLIISDTSRKFKPTIQGSYTVKTIQNGCTSLISSPYYYLITDLINLSSTEFIKLVPNPFVSQLNFDFTIKGYPRLNLDVFNITTGGLLISKQGLYAGSSIILSQLSAGSYIFRVSSSDGKISHQFKMVKL
jgi:hypothetical protein